MVARGQTSKGSVKRGTVKKGGAVAAPMSFSLRVEGLDNMLFKMSILRAKLEDPEVALQMIGGLFSLMEKQRFASGGYAPEFGIMNRWKPLQFNTMEWRKQVGGNPKNQPLLNFGYIADAATGASFVPVGERSMAIVIDPRKELGKHAGFSVSGTAYAHNENYAIYHQKGAGGHPPKRQFVTITPAFRAEATHLFEVWLRSGEINVFSGHDAQKDFGYAKRSYRKRRGNRSREEKERLEKARQKAASLRARERAANKKAADELRAAAHQRRHEILQNKIDRQFEEWFKSTGYVDGTNLRRTMENIKASVAEYKVSGRFLENWNQQNPLMRQYLSIGSKASSGFRRRG